MTQSEIRKAAMERAIVVARVRNSTEYMKVRGRITAVYDKYDTKGCVRPVVEICDVSDRCSYHIKAEDVLHVEGEERTRREQSSREDEYSYVVLGRVGPEEYRVMCYKNGGKAALYSGYVDEEKEIMRLFIKEPYVKGMQGKDKIALRLLGRA